LVAPPEYAPEERDTWSEAEVRAFLTAAAPDRLHPGWRLSLYGLRRGEVLGLRWADIDLKARTLAFGHAISLPDAGSRTSGSECGHSVADQDRS